MRKDKELLKFKIDQLRKDKMIYALESISLTLVTEFSYILLTILLNIKYSASIAIIALLVPLVYFGYMTTGNIFRWKEIKKLEKELYKK